MTLDGYTTEQLEELWHATYDALVRLLDRSDQLSDAATRVEQHGTIWQELAAQIEVLIAAIREMKELCETIRAEIDRRPVDA